MGLRSTIKGWIGSQATPAPTVAVVEATPDPRGTPGTRVHHEYFLADAPDVDGKWGWLARVYAKNGAVNEQQDRGDTQELARNAALTWCAKTKAILRGE